MVITRAARRSLALQDTIRAIWRGYLVGTTGEISSWSRPDYFGIIRLIGG